MSSVVSLTPEVRQYMLSWRSRVCIYCGNDRCLKRCKRCGVFVCSHECHTRSWVSTRVHRSCCERFHRIIVRHHRKADPFVGSPKRGKGDKEDAEKDESRKDEPPSARPKKDDVFDYDFEWWGDEKVLEDMSRIPQLNQPPDPVPAPGIQPSGPPSTSVSSTAPPAAPTAASPAATPAIPVFNVSGCDHVLFYKNVQRIPNAPPSSVSILLMEWANSGDLTVPSLFRLRTECLRNPVAPYSYEDARSWLAAQEQRQPIWLKLRKALAPASEAANFVGQGYVDHVPAGRIKSEYQLEQRFGVDVQPAMDHVKKQENESMIWGSTCEDSIRKAYAVLEGADGKPVQLCETGMVMHPLKPWFAASPDAVEVKYDTIVEIKTSKASIYNRPFNSWIIQGQMCMACTEKPRCHFVVCYVPIEPKSRQRPVMQVFTMEYSQPFVDRVMACAETYMDKVLAVRTSGIANPALSAAEMKTMLLPESDFSMVKCSWRRKYEDFFAAANEKMRKAGSKEPPIEYPKMPPPKR